jgi:MFS family permease
VIVLQLWVPKLARHTQAKTYLSWHIPTEIKPILAAIAVFALGNSSDAFLVLRAKEVGFDFGTILSLFIVFNLLAAAVGWLVGEWSDRYGRSRFLLVGWFVYFACYLGMGLTDSPLVFAWIFAIYGAFYGLTEGVEKALLSDLLPSKKRGMGYGAFQMTLAIVAIPANVMTGVIASMYGLSSALLVSACFSMTGFLILWMLRRRLIAPSP